MKPITRDVVLHIKYLQERINGLRAEYSISALDTVLWKEDLNSVDDRLLVVEADGVGGALCSQVRGNYPVDYLVEHHKVFIREVDATSFVATINDPAFGDGCFVLAEELWDKEPSQGN